MATGFGAIDRSRCSVNGKAPPWPGPMPLELRGHLSHIQQQVLHNYEIRPDRCPIWEVFATEEGRPVEREVAGDVGLRGRHSPPTDDTPLNVALDAHGTHMLCLFGS